MIYKDLTGKRFGYLTVIKPVGKCRYGTLWRCKCDCGNFSDVPVSKLNNGNTRSCGCMQHKKHCGTGSRLFFVWRNIKSRCYNPNFTEYELYGGRGIAMCDEWRNSFASFRDWALEHGYSENLSIDRIDNNGDYTPSNCKWSTAKEQANNRRTCHYLTANGKTMTISQWAEELHVPRDLIYGRLKLGWNIEDALFIPKGSVSRYEKSIQL